MNTSTLLRYIVVIICVTFACLATFAAAPNIQTLCFEAEDAQTITGKDLVVRPYKGTDENKASGGKVLAVPKGRQGEHSQVGNATYRIHIPEEGTYYCWARVFWSTGCGNSFFLQFDSYKNARLVLGGDSTYNTFHWVSLSDSGDNRARPLALSLHKGTLTMTLSIKESAVMVDQFLLTRDKKFEPAGIYQPTPNTLLPKENHNSNNKGNGT